MTSYYGSIRTGSVERGYIVSAPTLRAAQMKLRVEARKRCHDIDDLECYELRGTHAFKITEWARNSDGTTSEHKS